MNPNEEFYDDPVINSSQMQNNLLQQQLADQMDDRNRGTIHEQLDLEEEIEILDHLLRGHIQTKNKNGDSIWIEPKDNDDVLLSEAGINFILNSIRWYLIKNTLLSNYDDETINKKMEDVSKSLADALFMKYERYFLYLTPEECQARLIQRLKRKQQDVLFSLELQGKKVNPDEVWKKLVDEIDPSKERMKIREQAMKDKLKSYDWLMRVVQDTIHSAYNRAFGGQERKTLRQHIHVQENVTPNNRSNKNDGGGFFKSR